MSEFVDISKILKHVIETENHAAAAYKEFAHKAEALKPEIFYKPHQNKISWNEEVGFYKELEEKIMGTDSSTYFYKTLPPKVEKDDSIYFYRSLGDKYTDDVKSMFLAMSKEEEDHAETFNKLLDNTVNGGNSACFKKEILGYLQEHSEDARVITDITVPVTILRALEEAVSAEQRAVEFYSGMIPYANQGALEILKKIINEERGHEARLKSQINTYKLLIDQ